MKFILTADWHLRDDVPKSRTDRDTFFDEQFKKVEFIVNYAIEHDTTIMLAGDVFHKSKVSPKVINRLAETIRNDVDILVIPGNHDLPNHNPELLEESSYGTMLHLGLGTHFLDVYDMEQDLATSTPYKDIIMLHTLVWPEKKINKGFTTDELFKKYPQKLIVTGDNHTTFVVERDGRRLVNPGSLVRSSADQTNHRPCFFVYDDLADTLEQVFLPVKDNVLTTAHILEEEEKNDRLDAFISKVNTDWDADVDFKKNMDKYLELHKTDNTIENKIKQILR